MSTIDDQIKNKRAELAALEAKKREIDGRTPIQRLADAIHTVECHWNHADGCSWYYESWQNPGYARKDAMQKAQKILDVEPDIERLIRILNAIRMPQE